MMLDSDGALAGYSRLTWRQGPGDHGWRIGYGVSNMLLVEGPTATLAAGVDLYRMLTGEYPVAPQFEYHAPQQVRHVR